MVCGCKATTKLGIATTCGVLFVSLGVALIFIFKELIHNQIKEKIPITPTSDTLKAWKNPPADIYLQFWVFDVKNPYEVVHYGEPPVVVEKGPYTYREEMPKIKVHFYDNHTVSFQQPKTLIFDRSRSVGSDKDNFTSINILYLTAASFFRFEYSILQKFLNDFLELFKESLYTQYTVHDILWGLKHDTILEFIHSFAAQHNISLNLTDFGLFTNGSTDGTYTIFNGQGNINNFNIINKWDGVSKVEYWKNEWCEMINGTDGSLFPPFVDKSDNIEIFSTDICRSIGLKYEKERTVKGIDVWRFIPPSLVFGNIAENPDNIGFCTPDKDHCLGSGVLNISLCKFGAPVIVSQPHFYQGDRSYINGVIGLHPDKETHQTYIDLEPMTGAALNVAKRLQLNLAVMNVSNFVATEKITKLLIHPLLWLNESAVLNDKSARDFKSEILQPLYIMQAVQYGFIVLGGFVLICTLVVGIKVFYNKKNTVLSLNGLVVNEQQDYEE